MFNVPIGTDLPYDRSVDIQIGDAVGELVITKLTDGSFRVELIQEMPAQEYREVTFVDTIPAHDSPEVRMYDRAWHLNTSFITVDIDMKLAVTNCLLICYIRTA